ncbi:SacI homology domain-containing protein, partial [Amylocystis lapponica]
MKRFLSKSLKPIAPAAKPTPVQVPPSPVTNTNVHTTGLQPKYVLPPMPHPCPHEHIALLITPQGLLLRPHIIGQVHAESYVRIEWGKEGKVSELPSDEEIDSAPWSEGVVVYGIVGILTVFTASYLLVVSSRSDVGHLFEMTHTVFSVKGVTAIPLMEDRARTALNALASRHNNDPQMSLIPPEPSLEGSLDSTGVAEEPPSDPSSSAEPRSPHVKFANEDEVKMMTPLLTSGFDTKPEGSPPSPASSAASTPSSEYSLNTDTVVKTLTARLSFWGRLSKRTANVSDDSEDPETDQTEDPISLETMMKDGQEEPGQVIESILASTAPDPATTAQKHSELEEKIVRECVREFTRGGMYFAYNFDITRSLQHKHELIAKAKMRNALLADLNVADESTSLSPVGDKVDVLAEPSPTLPLWRRVDRQYWWNEWLSKPLVDAGLHSYVLPIMQGFYQIASFSVPREPVEAEEGDSALVDYIVVSRRSRDRAGLRYQRRGIDDDAHVANFVETETTMRVEREGFSNIFGHVQIRGSIPLYWNQQGYGLKPAPQLSPDRTHAQNLDALRRHFEHIVPNYGPPTIVNLAEQHGREANVTNAYRDYVKESDSKDVQYQAYDFHSETKGMKYENIAKLIGVLERTFENQGYFWVSNNSIMSQQKGVFRVNCIDGLDRTNVVEGTFARHVLNRQLGAVALLDPSEDKRTEMDVVFNDVWANNGDAISRAYAGTSALKGDFTRTGKRDLTGMLNDGVNSLARMYTSTFADWFSQAVIDYMLGIRTASVFSEFLLKLQSTDPRDLIRISKIRQDAIATCVSRVLSDGESLLSGWTLFSPLELNTKVGDKFEEKVLLLSVRALYVISYDYTLEKVKMYTRVPLGDIAGITKGPYILSPLEEGSRDPLQNAGFVIRWRNVGLDTRVTSYSIRNIVDVSSPATSPKVPPATKGPSAPSRRSTALSRILTNAAAPVTESDTTFAAFKALPIDPARTRRESGSFIEPADELAGATNCKDAVDIIVDAIRRACQDIGAAGDEFVTESEIVSLTEAQRMTSVYAKMEYGVKRLLWLG